GNSSMASQVIHVVDTTAPVISTLPEPSTIQCPATPSFATPTATDACDASPTLTFADVTTSSEEHTSELQSRRELVCRLLLENKNAHRPLGAGREEHSPPRRAVPGRGRARRLGAAAQADRRGRRRQPHDRAQLRAHAHPPALG